MCCRRRYTKARISAQHTADLIGRRDRYNRTALDVSLTDRVTCLLTAASTGAARGGAVSSALVCPPATKWSVKVSAKRSEDERWSEAVGSSASCATGDASCTEHAAEAAAVSVVGDSGWQEYHGPAPLAIGMGGGGKRCDITEVDGNVDSETFLHEYHSLRRPVVFRGAAAEWIARKKWTKGYLNEKMGGLMADCASIPYADKDGVAVDKMTVGDFFHLNHTERKTPLLLHVPHDWGSRARAVRGRGHLWACAWPTA